MVDQYVPNIPDFEPVVFGPEEFDIKDESQTNSFGDNQLTFAWDGPENADEEVESISKLKNEYEI